jgi:hypothetical protein
MGQKEMAQMVQATATEAAQAHLEATGFSTGFFFRGTMMTEAEFNAASDAASKPFYVYTRRALKNGDTKKGIRRFATRAAQINYINRAPWSIAITAWN